MIWAKMGRKIMVLEQHCCGYFNFCRWNAISQQLTDRAAPNHPPPTVLRFAPPGAALLAESTEGERRSVFSEAVSTISFSILPLALLLPAKTWPCSGNADSNRRFPEVFSEKKDVFEQNSKNHSSHLTCKRTQTTPIFSILSGGTSYCCALLNCRMIWLFMGIVKSIQLLMEIEQHKKDWPTVMTMMRMIVWWCWWVFYWVFLL